MSGATRNAVTGCPVTAHVTTSGPAVRTGVRTATLLYGALTYLVFLVVFTYTIGFVTDVAVPRSVDRGITAPVLQAVLVDLGLMGLFGIQHSVMARPVFKRWWTRFVPAPIERSTYVLFASAAIALLCWQWRPIGATVWQVDWTPARIALTTVGWLGWVVVLAATFMINHFELFGLRQAIGVWRSEDKEDTGFRTVLLYRVVRHPLMLGFLIAFWGTPHMTAGRLLFAATTTAYILVALQFEERDLIANLGEPYRSYRRRVPMLLPRLQRPS